MELQDKPIDPQESLELIRTFISGTKNNIRRSAFGFIFWGILIAVAALLNYFLAKFTPYNNLWLLWPILTIGGFIVTMLYYFANKKKEGVVSTFGHFFRWLFLCGGITYFLFVFLSAELKISPVPFILALTSLLVAVAGLALRFKPLFFGGVLFFLAAIASVFVSPLDQMLLIGVSFTLGYLIPGILLTRKENE